MVKALFISANLAALAILPFLYLGNVEAEHTAAAQEVAAGEEMIVEITINKGEISGPARLKLDFTDATDIVVEGVEKAGASFSFSGDDAVFTWSEVPSQEIITLKYKIIADPSASGTKTVSGAFSYLDESERAKYELPNIIFDVTESSIAAEVEPTPVEVEPEVNSTTVESTTDPMDVISCFRVVEKDGDDFIVSLNIDKGAYGGFARLKEYLPVGFKATKLQTENAVFKNVDNSVKFIWTSLPKDKSSLKLVYKLSPTTATDGDYSLTGEFSGEFMILNDVPRKFSIPKSIFTVEGQLAGGGNTSDGGNSNDGGSSNGGGSSSDGGDSSDGGSTVISTPAVSGVSYKVQILAAHKNVSSRYIKKRYGYSGKVSLENHEGWVKYVTGSFGVYKEARNKRETLGKYDLPGPFVTAYNTGERISVQEALTITSQDWVK